MSELKNKTISVRIKEPSAPSTWRMLFFNTYEITPYDGAMLVKFAFVDKDGQTQGSPLMVCFAPANLRPLKEDKGGYFAKLPLPSEEPLPKISSYPVSAPAQFPIFVNRIAVSDDKIHGELMLTTTRLFDAANIQKTKSDGEIEAIPIAILHSKVGLHARFLTDLLGSI